MPHWQCVVINFSDKMHQDSRKAGHFLVRIWAGGFLRFQGHHIWEEFLASKVEETSSISHRSTVLAIGVVTSKRKKRE